MPDLVLSTRPLAFVWETDDPFLFCVHHEDAYPRGDGRMAPAASLAGRNIGSDFEGIDGWRMYHGDSVPGFPQHPHRGFETVTLVRRGLVDHADSMGATGRFGGGDVQWMTAGSGVQHSEMFPLVAEDAGNPLEMFQIWLNLPAADKMVPPHYKMLWSEQVPTIDALDARGLAVSVTLVAGGLEGQAPPSPPPHSWASQADSDVAIWMIRLAGGASWTVPPARPGSSRTLYFFDGHHLAVGGKAVGRRTAVRVAADQPALLEAGPEPVEILMLQGRRIGEPVAHHGPFVMNTRAELVQAFNDYQSTRFGGWPWDRQDPVHERTEGRFARHADGEVERPA